MHPLFVAHLVADFLLQPTWLVEWKDKKNTGIVFHSFIHLIMATVLFWPQSIDAAILVASGAILHGLIDHIKITSQHEKVSYNTAFIFDQLAHFFVLFTIGILLSPAPQFWSQEGGKIILVTLLFFSIGVALHTVAGPQKTTKDILIRIGLVFFAFGIFTIASLALANGLSSAL